MDIQEWLSLGLTGFISLQSKGLKSFLQHSLKASVLQHWAFFMIQISHPYLTTGKTIALTIRIFVVELHLLFNTLSRFVITFLPRNKPLLISWLQSPSAMILEPKIIKSVSFHFFPFYLPWNDGARCHDLNFWILSFNPAFHSSLSPSSRDCLVSLHFLPL